LKKAPNRLLRQERERRSWSQLEVADQIGTTDTNVSRWERGITVPSPYFRQKLCRLFEKNADELGLVLVRQEAGSEQPLHQSPSNPARPDAIFFFNMNLPRASELYGRASERETLLTRAYNTASTSIVGPRRMGKTWLMEYLMLAAKTELGAHFRVGYLDATLSGCATIAGFTARAARALGVPLVPERVQQGLAALEEVVESLKMQDQRAVLCIDEFEGFRNRQEFDLNFFSGLRAIAQIGLVLVAASKRPLIDIVGEYGNTSGFFNIFEQLTLEPFSAEEAEAFIKAKGTLAGFTDQEQDALLKYGQKDEGQWPPVRLQLVGTLLWEEKTLAEGPHRYRPDDPGYWQGFEQRLEDKYRGVVR
jgi:transcriptional regulator with XRE-family HTH domain